MNNKHYPSLELCKKLTEIGFPDPMVHFIRDEDGNYDYTFGSWNYVDDGASYVCPSVMEMLDVIPREYTFEVYSTFWNEGDYGTPDNPYDGEINPLYQLKIHDEDEFEIVPPLLRATHYCNNIPNAIACKILWLHENNYISFSK